MNVHNERWLWHSDEVSPDGFLLERVYATQDLKQYREITITWRVLAGSCLGGFEFTNNMYLYPGVLESNHRCIVVDVNNSIALSKPTSRECFDFGKAQRTRFRKVFWDVFVSVFLWEQTRWWCCSRLYQFCSFNIQKVHPNEDYPREAIHAAWRDDKCLQLVWLKHAAIGTPDFIAARDRFIAGVRSAHASFLAKFRDNLRTANSKDWCHISKEFHAKSTGSENIPPRLSGEAGAKDPLLSLDKTSCVRLLCGCTFSGFHNSKGFVSSSLSNFHMSTKLFRAPSSFLY